MQAVAYFLNSAKQTTRAGAPVQLVRIWTRAYRRRQVAIVKHVVHVRQFLERVLTLSIIHTKISVVVQLVDESFFYKVRLILHLFETLLVICISSWWCFSLLPTSSVCLLVNVNVNVFVTIT
jgi:hypothetical protein